MTPDRKAKFETDIDEIRVAFKDVRLQRLRGPIAELLRGSVMACVFAVVVVHSFFPKRPLDC